MKNKRIVIEFEGPDFGLSNQQLENFYRKLFSISDKERSRFHILDNHLPSQNSASYVETQIAVSPDQIHEEVLGVRFYDAKGNQIGVCIGTCQTGHDSTEDS